MSKMTYKMFEAMENAQNVANEMMLAASKKACLEMEEAENRLLAKKHKKLSNQARKARDWALYLTLVKGEDRINTAREAAEWAAHHRNRAEVALSEAEDCAFMATTL